MRITPVSFQELLRLVRSVREDPSFVDSTNEETKLRSEKDSLSKAILYTSMTYRWEQGYSSAPILVSIPSESTNGLLP